MRLRRLILGRYGHLSDVEIAFSDSPRLHIVLGANEAGKSTALSAVGDCLFRFPHRTPYDFLHAPRDLRIGVTLQAADGQEETFFRRKGRKEDLFDAQDRPLPESAILRFLGGATRDRFDRVFGLNGAELRQGGEAILKGHGEVGEAILGAHTGLHGFRDLVAKLDAQAKELFGDRKGQRQFHKAVERFHAARHERDERRVDPAAWKQVQDELAKLEQARVGHIGRAKALHAERSRLDRIRRTTPARLVLSRLLAEREALGPVPALPPDAADRFHAAMSGRDQAARDQAREQERLAALIAEHDALPEQTPILAQGEAIDALADDRLRIAGALKDRETQRLVATQRAEVMREDGRRLGLTLDADDLAARIPCALDREAVAQALQLHARLSGQQATRQEQREAVEEKLAAAKAALAALPVVEEHFELRAAIEAVKAEGPLDARLAEAEGAARAASAELGRALAALPLWRLDAAALAAAPVPLEADVQRVSDRLMACAEAVRGGEARLAEHDAALAELAAQAEADAVAGALPTVDAIQAARSRRDAAWALIRRAHLDGGAAVSDAERGELGLSSDLAAGFEGLVREADRLADRRAAEQERVVAAEQRRAEQIRRQALRDADGRRWRVDVDRLDAARAEWRALWTPCGIEPGEPAAMREWMQRRALVLAEFRTCREAAQALEGVRTRHDRALDTLAVLLPEEARAAGGSVSALLGAAQRVCSGREDQAACLSRLRDAVAAAEAERGRVERAAARGEAEWAAWREAWGRAARSLSLAPDVPPELGRAALALWSAIDVANRERRDAGNRVAEMTLAIEAFGADADAMVRRVAPDLAGTDPLEVVSVLSRRLAAAREDSRRRRELAEQIAGVRAAVAAAAERQRGATEVLEDLRRQVGAADDAALGVAIERAALHRDLLAAIREREAELAALSDGKTLEELAAEAGDAVGGDVDFDTLPARIAGIDAELGQLRAAELENHEATLRLRQARDAMELGRDAAASAQAMEGALADIEDIAGRYVPLRMAHTLLRAGIERFRRQQQGPLLLRAGQIFARLTEGRYERLEVDERENGDVFVVACQPGGGVCPAEKLSEGTLDQLYLALRLAAMETEARAAEPLPFIGDDLLVNFDDRRAGAALRVLGEFAERVTQVILFTHHEHIAALAEAGMASVYRLGREVVGA